MLGEKLFEGFELRHSLLLQRRHLAAAASELIADGRRECECGRRLRRRLERERGELLLRGGGTLKLSGGRRRLRRRRGVRMQL